MLRNSIKKRSLGIYISIVVLVLIAIVVGFIMYKYQVEGEKKLPFNVSEFLIISTAQTDNTTLQENVYQSEIIQKNDVYISFEKNNEYKKDDVIKKITFSNFKITGRSEKGITNVYRPSMSEKLYEYNETYVVTNGFEYIGDKLTDIKGEILTIGNQGGVIKFSIATTSLGSINYPEKENIISDGRLLNNINVSLEDVSKEVSFDMVIEIQSGVKFKSNIILKIPTGDIGTDGVSTSELDVNKLVFKRF